MDKKTIKRLLTYCKPYRFLIMLLTLLSIVSVIFTLLTPVLLGQAIDLLVGKNQVDFQGLFNKLIFIGVVVLIISLIQWIMGQITNTITYNITNDLRNRVFDQIQVLPLKYIDATSHGDILGRLINDIDLIGQGLLQSFTSLLTGIATIVGTILIMAYIHFSVAVIVVVLTPLSLLVASLIVKRTHSYFQEQLAIRGEMNGFCEEMIGNQKIVNIFDYQVQNEEKFNEINERMHKSGVISQFYGALINPTTRLVNSIVYAAVGIYGAFQVLNGSFTVGILSSFLTYANQYTKPFNEISSVMSEMQTAIAASQRVFALLDEETIQELTTSKIIENKQGHIIIDHLNFSYDPSKPLIQDFNYEAKPGTMTAIVGKTGCGKTTLINLLMRFYDPQKGKITIDGQDIASKKVALNSTYTVNVTPDNGYAVENIFVNNNPVEDVTYANQTATVTLKTGDLDNEIFNITAQIVQCKLDVKDAEVSYHNGMSTDKIAQNIFAAVVGTDNVPEITLNDVTIEYDASLTGLGNWKAIGYQPEWYEPTLHEFGKSTEKIRITYKGTDKYPFMQKTVTITLKDLREETTLSINDGIMMKYQSTEMMDAVIKVLIAQNATVTDKNGNVIDTTADDFTYTPSTDEWKAGEQEITVTYNGNEDYLSSSATTTITIKKGDANVWVNSQNIKYKRYFEIFRSRINLQDRINNFPNCRNNTCIIT